MAAGEEPTLRARGWAEGAAVAPALRERPEATRAGEMGQEDSDAATRDQPHFSFTPPQLRYV